MLLQITNLSVNSIKVHLKSDINLVPKQLADHTWAHRDALGILLNRPLPCSCFITFTHEEVQFKEQKKGGKAPSHTFSSSFYAVIVYNEIEKVGRGEWGGF